MHFWLPGIAGFLYVIGALFFKRASIYGVGVWRTAFLANWALMILFQPFWLTAGDLPPLSAWIQPAVTGVLFLGGQLLTFLAIQRGDVSVATPVLGVKVLFVALLSTLFGVQEVPTAWWAGAFFSSVGIFLLGRSPGTGVRGHGGTVATAAGAAACYAMADVLTQKWGPGWGGAPFLGALSLIVAFLSFGFIPFFRGKVRSIPTEAWRWVAAGAFFMGLQAAGICYTLAVFGEATAANIFYGLRGLWSVLLVLLVGSWLGLAERIMTGRVLVERLIGAVLMIVSVVVVLIS